MTEARELLAALSEAWRASGTDAPAERLERAAHELERFARARERDNDRRTADAARMAATDLRGMVRELETP